MLTPRQEERAELHALRNALAHGGRPDAGSVLGRLIAEFPELKERVRDIRQEVGRITASIGELSEEEMRARLSVLDEEEVSRPVRGRDGHTLPPLPEAERGRVVLRLAPFPSGPLHVGNLRMALLNDAYARMYEGRLLLVFDDTIGSEEKVPIPEGYDLIREGLELMGVKVDAVYHKSDRMEEFYAWGERLIRSGRAYACECRPDTLRSLRAEGVECPHRERGSETSLELWERMLAGGFSEGEMCIRIKSDMRHPDPAFRDRVLFRVSGREHPRVGSRYSVWPMLEMSWAVDDDLLGVTHIIRGKDLMIEDEMERLIWRYLDRPGKVFVHYGMLRVPEARLSKSKSMQEVRSGLLSGWDDPRTWSVQSLARRGILPEAVRAFILSFGLSLTDIEVPAESLYARNRRLIDPVSPRRFFVPDPVELELHGEVPGRVTLRNHPDNTDLGTRDITVSGKVHVPRRDAEGHTGSEVRLKDLCNVMLTGDGRAVVTSLEVRPLRKVQWVSSGAHTCDLLMPDGTELTGLIEPNPVEADRVVQFERVGFARVEEWARGRVRAVFAHR